MKKNVERLSYNGSKVFVGIDVHKRTYKVAVQVEGLIVKKWTMAARPMQLSEQLLRYFPGGKIETVYEAGFSGFHLHRILESTGIKNLVVNASDVEVAGRQVVKTDKRDAKKLAEQLAAGRLKGIRVPSRDEEDGRLLNRARQSLVEQRAAMKNRVRMKFHQYGYIDPEDKREMSHKLVTEILTKHDLPEELLVVIRSFVQIWEALSLEIKRFDKKLIEQAAEDQNEVVYRSAPGVGPLTARILSNELGDMSQFQNERQLFCFTGLTPSEHSSGDHVHRGHISRAGSSRIRHVLVEAAWRAIKEDISLATKFEKLVPRTGKKRAIVAVARTLIGRIRATFRQGSLYKTELIPLAA